MADIALHIRIFDVNPTDELVEKRTAAIKDIAAKLSKKRPTTELVQFASDIARLAEQGAGASALGSEMVASIKKQSPAFIAEDRDLEVGACVLIAALQAIDVAPSKVLTAPVFLASCLWSALSFQSSRPEPRLEALRAEVLTRARALSLASAAEMRLRMEVPAMEIKTDAADFPKFASAVDATAEKSIGALRTNAALDREELDVLWWVLGDWSEIAGARISSLAPAVAAVVSGIELASLMRRLPAQGHRNLSQKWIVENAPLSLEQLCVELDRAGVRGPLSDRIQSPEWLQRSSAVFPLLSTLAPNALSVEGAVRAREPMEWGARALLEGTLRRLVDNVSQTM